MGSEELIERMAAGGAVALGAINARLIRGRHTKRIRCLDDISALHASTPLPGATYAPYEANEMKRMFVDRQLLSRDLNAYSGGDREYIAANALSRIHEGVVGSSYLSENAPLGELDTETLKRNRQIFARTYAFRKYLDGQSVANLDDVEKPQATKGLGKLLGFAGGRPTEMRKRLVELGVFSLDLRAYARADQERVCARVIERGQERTNWTSAYFEPAMDPETLVANRRTLVRSSAFTHYLRERDILTLDDVTARKTPDLLALGLSCGRAQRFKDALVSYGAMSIDLNDVDPYLRERVASTIIEKRNANVWKSAYFTNVPTAVLASNQRAIFGTETMKEFLTRELGERGQYPITKDVRSAMRKLGYRDAGAGLAAPDFK